VTTPTPAVRCRRRRRRSPSSSRWTADTAVLERLGRRPSPPSTRWCPAWPPPRRPRSPSARDARRPAVAAPQLPRGRGHVHQRRARCTSSATTPTSRCCSASAPTPRRWSADAHRRAGARRARAPSCEAAGFVADVDPEKLNPPPAVWVQPREIRDHPRRRRHAGRLVLPDHRQHRDRTRSPCSTTPWRGCSSWSTRRLRRRDRPRRRRDAARQPHNPAARLPGGSRPRPVGDPVTAPTPCPHRPQARARRAHRRRGRHRRSTSPAAAPVRSPGRSTPPTTCPLRRTRSPATAPTPPPSRRPSMQDDLTAGGLVDYSWAHKGEQVPFTFTPYAGGRSITGELIVDPLDVGGDVGKKNTSDIKWAAWASPSWSTTSREPPAPRSRSRGCAPCAARSRPRGVPAGPQGRARRQVAQLVVRAAPPARRTAPARSPPPAGRAGQTAAVVRAGRASVPYAGPIHWGWPSRHITAQPFSTTPRSTRRTSGPGSTSRAGTHHRQDRRSTGTMTTPHLIDALETSTRAPVDEPGGPGPPAARQLVELFVEGEPEPYTVRITNRERSPTRRPPPGTRSGPPPETGMGQHFAMTFMCGPRPSAPGARADVRAVAGRSSIDWDEGRPSPRTLPGRQCRSAVRRAVARHTHSVRGARAEDDATIATYLELLDERAEG
jgi:hypothetical protein